MKLFLIVILSVCTLLFSSFSGAHTDVNKTGLVDFVVLNEITSSTWSVYKVKHYCHMKTVYVERVIHGKADSLTMIWNHDTNSPLKCEDYHKYINALIKK